MKYRLRGTYLLSKHGVEIQSEITQLSEVGAAVEKLLGSGADIVTVIQFDE